MRQHAGSAILFVALLRAPATLMEVLDEAAEGVDEWFGTSCLLSSSTPVAGEVLWVSSHCSMALRSYVWPSTC